MREGSRMSDRLRLEETAQPQGHNPPAVGPGGLALLLYCRPGFEKEAAAEIQEQAASLGILGFVKAVPDSGYLVFTSHGNGGLEALRLERLIFARQLICCHGFLDRLPPADRITPLLEHAQALGSRYREIWLETADTNAAKELARFLRRFEGPFRHRCSAAGLVDSAAGQRLHLFFLDSATVYLGTSRIGNSSPWPLGIPRLKFPRAAPSRSTLKLEEAFLHFLGTDSRCLQPGMTAVDLGAAPGGWTWQLMRRSIRVTAVDNGPLDPALLESGIVQHVRADGFRFRPPRPVDWLVCDMVEQPSRVADLVGSWLAERRCRSAIFNLKLPMKKRLDEVRRCAAIIGTQLARAGVGSTLRFKQLYHDREEVTGYCRLDQS